MKITIQGLLLLVFACFFFDAYASAQPGNGALPSVSPELQELALKIVQSNTVPADIGKLLKTFADKGDPVAKFLYAVAFLKDQPELQVKLFKESAEGGCPAAATLYSTHLFSAKDPEALSWLKKGAYQGDAMAQMLIGAAYASNKGELPQDLKKAYAWLSLAEQQIPIKSMTAPIALQKINLLMKFSEEEKLSAEKEFQQLKSKIGIKEIHPCGQSIPMRANINDQISSQKHKPPVSVFDKFKVFDNGADLNSYLTQMSGDKAVLVVVTAKWDTNSYSLSKWLANTELDKVVRECCEVIIGDVTENQALLEHYRAFGSPVFVFYSSENRKKPMDIKMGSFSGAQDFQEWLKKLIK